MMVTLENILAVARVRRQRESGRGGESEGGLERGSTGSKGWR